METPLGRVGEIDQVSTGPPFEEGVISFIVWFTIKLNVLGEIEMDGGVDLAPVIRDWESSESNSPVSSDGHSTLAIGIISSDNFSAMPEVSNSAGDFSRSEVG